MKRQLDNDEQNQIRQGSLGHLLDLPENKFASQLMRHLVLRQTKEGNDDELTFNFGGQKCNFGIKEFALITGLNCGRPPRKYKHKSKKNYTRKMLVSLFKQNAGSNSSDRVKMGNLYLLENFLLPKQEATNIDITHVEMLDEWEEFNNYPWGRTCYELTINSVKKALDNINVQKMTFNGLPHALVVWAYETLPLLQKLGYVTKVNSVICPRMLRWSSVSQPAWEELEEKIFSNSQVSKEKKQ